MYKHFLKRFFDFWIALVALISCKLVGEDADITFLPCDYVAGELLN